MGMIRSLPHLIHAHALLVVAAELAQRPCAPRVSTRCSPPTPPKSNRSLATQDPPAHL